jgi:hypothetical protein
MDNKEMQDIKLGNQHMSFKASVQQDFCEFRQRGLQDPSGMDAISKELGLDACPQKQTTQSGSASSTPGSAFK